MAYDDDFKGPWLVGTPGVAAYSGVYHVCVQSLIRPWLSIYVGQSGDIEGRIARHERYSDWLRVAAGRTLYFFAKEIESQERRRQVEQEMIDRYNPLCNSPLSLFADSGERDSQSKVQALLVALRSGPSLAEPVAPSASAQTLGQQKALEVKWPWGSKFL